MLGVILDEPWSPTDQRELERFIAGYSAGHSAACREGARVVHRVAREGPEMNDAEARRVLRFIGKTLNQWAKRCK